MRNYKIITKETSELFICINSTPVDLKVDSDFTMSS